VIVHPPGDVPDGHPGLTPRVIAAVARAALIQYHEHQITDEDGPTCTIGSRFCGTAAAAGNSTRRSKTLTGNPAGREIRRST
jgi:hypothetical protein